MILFAEPNLITIRSTWPHPGVSLLKVPDSLISQICFISFHWENFPYLQMYLGTRESTHTPLPGKQTTLRILSLEIFPPSPLKSHFG